MMTADQLTVAIEAIGQKAVTPAEAVELAAVMEALLALREEAELGRAWHEAEAALPKSRGRWGYSISSLSYGHLGWTAIASGSMSVEWIEAHGATPALALKSLAARCREGGA
jgi:hypothetical protein